MARQGAGVVTGSVSQAVPDDRDGGISFVTDEGNNAIVVSATPGEWRRIRQVLSEVDVMPPQVLDRGDDCRGHANG